MRKLLKFRAIALLVVLLTSLNALAWSDGDPQIYLVGSCTDGICPSTQSWDIDNGNVILNYDSEDKVYKASGVEMYDDCYFAIFTELGSYTSNRYAGTTNDIVMQLSQPLTLAKKSISSMIFYGSAGCKYDFTVDMSAMTLLITEPAGYGNVNITPAAGLYKTPLTVNISYSYGTIPNGGAIYYTTDGTEPNTTSNIYTAPFDIVNVGDVTVNAKVIDNNGSSDLATATYDVYGIYNSTYLMSTASPYNSYTLSEYNLDQKFKINIQWMNGHSAPSDLEIRYTTDGSTPTADSRLYTTKDMIQLSRSGNSTIKWTITSESEHRTSLHSRDFYISETLNGGEIAVAPSDGDTYYYTQNFSAAYVGDNVPIDLMLYYTTDGTFPDPSNVNPNDYEPYGTHICGNAFNLPVSPDNGTTPLKVIGYSESANVMTELFSKDYKIFDTNVSGANLYLRGECGMDDYEYAWNETPDPGASPIVIPFTERDGEWYVLRHVMFMDNDFNPDLARSHGENGWSEFLIYNNIDNWDQGKLTTASSTAGDPFVDQQNVTELVNSQLNNNNIDIHCGTYTVWAKATAYGFLSGQIKVQKETSIGNVTIISPTKEYAKTTYAESRSDFYSPANYCEQVSAGDAFSFKYPEGYSAQTADLYYTFGAKPAIPTKEIGIKYDPSKPIYLPASDYSDPIRVRVKAFDKSDDSKYSEVTSAYFVVQKAKNDSQIMIKAKMPYDWNGRLRAYAWYYDITGAKRYISDMGTSQSAPITVAMEDDGNGWWHLTFEPSQTLVGIRFTDTENPSDAKFLTAEFDNISETSYFEVSATKNAPVNYAPIINKSFNGSSELQSIFEGHNRSIIPVNIDVFATADSELTTGVMFDNDQTFIIGEGVNVELAPSEFNDPIYGCSNQNKFHYLVLEDGAKIGSPDANVYSVDSLRIIYKITPDPETKFNKQWASIAAPFSAYINAPIDYSDANDDFNLSFKVTKGDAAGNYIPNAEPLVRGVDFETFTYSGELRANPEGVGPENWKIPENNKDQVGEVIQVLDNNTVHYCEFYTKVDAPMALGYGAREMELFYDESGTVPTADNGWSMCAANKTYDDVYEKPSYYGFTPATAQFLQIFDPETTGFYTREFGVDKIATGTAYVVQLVDDNATLSTTSSSEDIETYKFILTDNEGKELDRIYIASNTLSSKYRLAKMSSLVAAPQMVVNANNTDYTVYSTASTESENSFDIEISGLDTEGAKLVLASAGTEQVSINDKKAILESPISVENGTVNIVIGNKPTSVGGAITSGIKVYGINGAIVIESAEAGAEYIISDAAGVKVAGVMSADSATITKDAGVYIVGVNGIYTKVIVK